MPNLQLLATMLTYCRPCGSTTEAEFVNRFLLSLPHHPYQDPSGNIIVQVGPPNPTVAWSCHTDTVHNKPGRQLPLVSRAIYSLPPGSPSSCLGADDTAGVWLMHQMVTNSIPGLYIFHYGEEVGGIGSRYIAQNTPELLAPLKAIIALDRKGTTSVITHQAGGRCASDAFANSLIAQLPFEYAFKPDSGGTFTDTANYTELVSECSNLSVGYDWAHSPTETLDATYLYDLYHSLATLDHSKLVFQRDPTIEETHFEYFTRHTQTPDAADFQDLVDLVQDNPEQVAALLSKLGYDAFNLIDDLDEALFIRQSLYGSH